MEKKTKLTISGTAKKSIKNIEIAKVQGKNSVVIEKQVNKFSNRGGSFKPSGFRSQSTSNFNKGTTLKNGSCGCCVCIILSPSSYSWSNPCLIISRIIFSP